MAVFSQGIVDESCAAHFGRWGAWRCYLGQYAAPFLEARTLFLQNQIDEWQGFWNGFFSYASNSIAFEYVFVFATEVRKFVSNGATECEPYSVLHQLCVCITLVVFLAV